MTRHVIARPSSLVALVLVVALSVPAAAVLRGAEVVASGGGAGESASYRAHDVIGQGPIGPMAEDTDLRLYDGFLLVLPSINVPVEGSFWGSVTESGSVMLNWNIASLAGITGFHLYRSTSQGGPFERITAQAIPAAASGEYEDTTVWPETTFWYELRAVFADGTEDLVEPGLAYATTGGRLTLALYPPYPNPATDGATLRFDVPDEGTPVRLRVYNARGALVRTLVDGRVERGRHTRVWDRTDEDGYRVSSAVYFVMLESAGAVKTEKMLLIR
jgi:hypothetical protein